MSSQIPPRPPGPPRPPANRPGDRPANKPAPKPAAPKPAAGKRPPESALRRDPSQPSKVIVVGIVIGFVASAACAVAPLIFRVSNWWLALSLFLLIISAVSASALRE